jgi:hypothetical protein
MKLERLHRDRTRSADAKAKSIERRAYRIAKGRGY